MGSGVGRETKDRCGAAPGIGSHRLWAGHGGGRCLRKAALLRTGREKGGGRGLQAGGQSLWIDAFLICLLKVKHLHPAQPQEGSGI